MGDKAKAKQVETEEDEDDLVDDIDDELDDDGDDVDRVFRDLEKAGRIGAKCDDPAWRRLERLREEKLTAELVSDFDDYDIGVDDDGDTPAGKRTYRRLAG
ncbi:MAG: hypothetical protein R3E77_11390 [Steroidobacteraceae bacterium]